MVDWERQPNPKKWYLIFATPKFMAREVNATAEE